MINNTMQKDKSDYKTNGKVYTPEKLALTKANSLQVVQEQLCWEKQALHLLATAERALGNKE